MPHRRGERPLSGGDLSHSAQSGAGLPGDCIRVGGRAELTVAVADTRLDIKAIRQASLPRSFTAETIQSDVACNARSNLAELCPATEPRMSEGVVVVARGLGRRESIVTAGRGP